MRTTFLNRFLKLGICLGLVICASQLVGQSEQGSSPTPVIDFSKYAKSNDANSDAIPAFEKALASLTKTGGIIKISKGEYTLSSDRSVIIPSNVTIQCDRAAIFHKSDGAKPIFKTVNSNNIFIKGGIFYGPGNQSCFFWEADGTRNFGIEGCQFINFASAMRIGGSSPCQLSIIKNNTFAKNLLTGLSIANLSGLTLQGNTFDSNGVEAGITHGAYLITVSDANISNNIFSNNCGYGLHIYVSHKNYGTPKNITIDNNSFTGNGAEKLNGGGIIVSGVVDGIKNIIISNNKFLDNNIGIAVISVSNYKIINNYIKGSKSYGIYLGEELNPKRDAQSNISGNHVESSKMEAIRLGLPPTISGIKIEDNDFSFNGSGIAVRSGYQSPKKISLTRNKFTGTKDGKNIAAGLPVIGQDQ